MFRSVLYILFILFFMVTASYLLFAELKNSETHSLQEIPEQTIGVSTNEPPSITESATTTEPVSSTSSTPESKATITPAEIIVPDQKTVEAMASAVEPITTAPVVQTPPQITPEPVTPPLPAKKIDWGVFTGSNKNALNEFENRVDANPDYLAFFVHWGNHGGSLPLYVKDYAYKKDRTLILFWEASDYMIGGTDQPAYAYRRILAGDWDEYIKQFKAELVAYEGPVILIPFSELNGDWTPWSGTENGNTPEESILAFRYLHERMSDLPNVSFGWAVNRMSIPNTPENAIERYYPGDKYVDYVGVDGFNKGAPWLTFSDIFDAPLKTLSQYNKPTFIFSFGSAPGSLKAGWLDTALNVDLPKHPHVVSWVYFNQDKERNWLLWSDEQTFDVFTDYIESD